VSSSLTIFLPVIDDDLTVVVVAAVVVVYKVLAIDIDI
jgi:hypothetical protein